MTEIKQGLQDVVVSESTISYIDGQKGILVYAGINIHELAENSTFEETAYLLLHRKLPTQKELDSFNEVLKAHRQVPDGVIDLIRRLPKTTEPMDALRTAASALSSYEEQPHDNSLEQQKRRVLQLIAQMATLVAAFQRIRSEQEVISPNPELTHAENFLYMLKGDIPDATAARAIDIALILHADHGLNASTFAARVTTSTLSDVYSAITSAIGTLKGPLHGGANQKVMEMLLEIGENGDPIAYVKKELEKGKKVMGFGHRVYRTEDPRATHLRTMSEEACRVTGNSHWYEMSHKIEDYIKSQKGINANVDFYSASVYYSLGIPTDLFTLLFAMSRIAGWGAHILEQYENNRLIRPRLQYVGPRDAHWIPIQKRS